MKKIKLLISLITCIVLSGCGHTMYHKVQGTGVYGRVPLPNGNSLVEVAIGDMNITSGILRGGATLDENSSKGGTFGAVSLGRHTYLSTSPAMNEGYIAEVLTSQKTDDKTKQLLAQYLITRKNNIPPPSGVNAVNTSSATGNKNEVPNAEPAKVGWDNIVDKASDTIVKVAPFVKDGTVAVVDKASKSIENSVVEGTYNWKKISDNISIISISFSVVVIIIALLIFILIKKKKQKQI